MTGKDPDKRALRRQYKETTRPAGVFAIQNLPEGVWFIGTSSDVPSKLNSQRFQLEMGVHPQKELQADWRRLGPDAFAFETLDLLEPEKDSERNPKDELSTLQDLWLTKLTSDGQRLYTTRQSTD